MENPLRRMSARNSTRLLLILSVTPALAACKLPPLKIDPCAVWADEADRLECHAVPLNQPEKPEYDRLVIPSDICVTADDYAALQKHYREAIRLCGDRCK